jgi:hypothetical protein
MSTTLVVKHSDARLPIATKLVASFLSSSFKVDFQVDNAANVPELTSSQAKFVSSNFVYCS